jgi:ABC-type multidrug transport system fused ATPase/permease subunit
MHLWGTNRWLSIRVDTAGALVSFFAGTFILLNIDKLDAGLAGLSLTYAITFTEHILWLVRLYSLNEMNMNSVERVRNYTHVETEAARRSPKDQAPPRTWPAKGAIKVEGLTLRYAPDLPTVIRDVTFEVEPSAKVAVVGRTGAGKSTIATAFFRFLEADSGSIIIDGIDISKIGLDELRSKMAIIPQDPTLFKGTPHLNWPSNHRFIAIQS